MSDLFGNHIVGFPTNQLNCSSNFIEISLVSDCLNILIKKNHNYADSHNLIDHNDLVLVLQ